METTQFLATPRRRRWVAAAAAGILVAGLLLAIVLLDRDSEDPTPPTAGSPTTTTPQTPGPRPTAAGMEAFIRNYLDTVVRDPAVAWSLLTSGFQTASGGYDAYIDWWGGLRKATVKSVEAEPDDLTVTYEVRYDWANDQEKGKLKQDEPTLELTFDGRQYLIAYEE